MKYIYFGTSEFAARILEKLLEEGMTPVAVVTQPDRPAGRGKKLQQPPVKMIAKKYDIALLQPERISNLKSQIADLKPDVCVVAAYGGIIPKGILEIPKHGFVNVHPSLLPTYRGPSPIQAAILNGDTETGVTLILLDEKIDHGPTLANCKWQIANSMTAPELEKTLAEIGAKLLIKIIPDWIGGKIVPRSQDHSKATFTKMLTKEDGKIDWAKSAQEIERQIRAFTPWPGTWTNFGKQRLKILAAEILNDNTNNTPGVVSQHPKGFSIACDTGSLLPTLLQLEGKKPCDSATFLRGHGTIIGSQLQ